MSKEELRTGSTAQAQRIEEHIHEEHPEKEVHNHGAAHEHHHGHEHEHSHEHHHGHEHEHSHEHHHGHEHHHDHTHGHGGEEDESRSKLIRIIVCAALLIVLHFINPGGIIGAGLYLAAYLIIGYDILLEAFEGIREGEVLDECFLMAVATLGAWALAIMQKSGSYTEAVAVMLFYQIGEWFQDYAVDRSRDSITALMDIRPDYANIMREGELVRVDPDTVEIGTEIVIQPGEKVPIDGTVISGSSALDTSALTGESVPQSVNAGEEIISGCVNLTGVLTVRTTKDFDGSTVSKILELMEEASEKKARSENFISRFAEVYTPIVCGCALALAVIPPIISYLVSGDAGFTVWLYRALTFLVISCPCALVISIPLTFFAGIGGAGRAGILVKGSVYLETLSRVQTVAFDKTGTLTEGVFRVTDIHAPDGDKEALLRYAAYAEIASSHPIARSIREAYLESSDTPIDRDDVTGIEEIAGQGIRALVSGEEVLAGNAGLMESHGMKPDVCEEAGTLVYLAAGGQYRGYILISDVIRPEAEEAAAALNKRGVKTVMLTGDREETAAYVSAKLGIGEYYAKLLPADKVRKTEELIEKGVTAFAGDGINDAPVLSRADVGIAMGAMGSDAAIEAADIVIMDDDPRKIARGMRIAEKCMKIVYENIWFAVSVKVICLILGALGATGMWMAIFADVGVMIIAVLNAMRAFHVQE